MIGSIYAPSRCPVILEAEKARVRAGELGIKSARGVLLYIAERLTAKADSICMNAGTDDSSHGLAHRSLVDAAAQCLAIAKMEAP
jgi:hypothetical protein